MIDILDIADMVVVVVVAVVDGSMSWNGNGGMVGYGSMNVEETIGLSVIDDGNVGKDVDVDEEGRRTPMVAVVTQQQGVVPTNNFHEEGIAVACLSDDRRILFLFRDQEVAGYGSMNVEEMIDLVLATFRLEIDIHTMGAYYLIDVMGI